MLTSIFGFLLVIAIIVFIHELGHYVAARLCGVRILEFSIGFGKSLFQIKDSKNTIWKICAFPLGGYVKMYGDQNIYSDHNINDSFTKNSKNETLNYFINLKKTHLNYSINDGLLVEFDKNLNSLINTSNKIYTPKHVR